MWALSWPERKALISRLGYLNLWDPMRPDGTYHLALNVPDERQMAVHLVRLAVVEPGENWEDECYNDIVGWEVRVCL